MLTLALLTTTEPPAILKLLASEGVTVSCAPLLTTSAEPEFTTAPLVALNTVPELARASIPPLALSVRTLTALVEPGRSSMPAPPLVRLPAALVKAPANVLSLPWLTVRVLPPRST